MLAPAAGQITDQAFVGEVREALERSGVEANLIELDVTEDVLLYDTARSARTLAALKSLGVRLAVDAVGPGQAAFAGLQRVTRDAVELHTARVDGVAFDLDEQRYAEGVMALARALGLAVVATGVANAADVDFLRANGCASLQGPLGPHDLSAGDCEAALRARR